MKKKILLFTAAAAVVYIGFSSNSTGPAASGNNRCGAQASSTTCGGGGCHGGTSAATVATITVDSAGGVPVTRYKPGMTYTVTVSGTNTSSLPAYGFQFASVKGIGATQTQAGTASGFATGIASHSFSGLNFVEHSAGALAGSPAGVYSTSFSWTAPAAGTGTVTMYLTVNAVNDNTAADAADVSGNTSKTLTEITPSTAVSNVSGEAFGMYPNPVRNSLNIQLPATATGLYSVDVFGINGQLVAHTQADATNMALNTLNTTLWAPGIYSVVVSGNGLTRAQPVIKQ